MHDGAGIRSLPDSPLSSDESALSREARIWGLWQEEAKIMQEDEDFLCVRLAAVLRNALRESCSFCLLISGKTTPLFHFPGESACNAGDVGSISESERSPREGNSNPLQCSGLENLSMGESQRSLAGYSPWGHKASDTT